MDSSNNNFEKSGEAYTSPSPQNGSAQGNPPYSQGCYPQPPEWTKNIVISDKPWIPSGEEGNVSVQFNKPEKTEADSEAYEGKIYNNKELQKELKLNDYSFDTNKDEELILKSYDCWKD